MAKSTSFIEKMGDLNLIVYDFKDKDDILEMHTHDESTVHISIVARGDFLIRGNDWEENYSTGSIIDWEPYQMHEFIALTPNSRLVNITKYKKGTI